MDTEIFEDIIDQAYSEDQMGRGDLFSLCEKAYLMGQKAPQLEGEGQTKNETTGSKSFCNDGLVCPSCGWAGHYLKKEGCLTDADEWYVCPVCGLDGSKMRRAD